jgi:SAM-dependent methyltransferase
MGRREPRRDDPDYLGSQALSCAIQRAIATELRGRADLDVVDVGCGEKPFFPYFQPLVRSYLGTEIRPGPGVDRICPAERLDLPEASADVVVCFSVLEHVDDPEQAVRELRRILRPGGVVFASTHGCFPWHPYPQDHWRWTQTGLPLLFERAGGFSSVELSATRGTVSGMFFLLAHYAYGWASARAWRRWLRGGLVRSINWLGEVLDALTPGLADPSRVVTAIPEFFVVARP